MSWTPGLAEEIREKLYPGQVDLFDVLGETPPFRPHVRCKKCGRLWRGEDARSSPTKASRRGCWFVSHSLVKCPECLKAEVEGGNKDARRTPYG